MAPSPQPNGYLNTVLNTPPRAGHSVAPTFSATQRSLQARNKDFGAVGKKEESYEVRQRREEAARILESAEMLIWWSSARNQVNYTISHPAHIFLTYLLVELVRQSTPISHVFFLEFGRQC
jgi:hypothetical protein